MHASDVLFGDAGNDTIIGGNAADTIEGGADDDIMAGVGGADHFVFRAGTPGDDTIVDFDTTADVVELVDFAADFDPLANLSASTSGPPPSSIWPRRARCCSSANSSTSSAPRTSSSPDRPGRRPGSAAGAFRARSGWRRDGSPDATRAPALGRRGRRPSAGDLHEHRGHPGRRTDGARVSTAGVSAASSLAHTARGAAPLRCSSPQPCCEGARLARTINLTTSMATGGIDR